jgi:hypothetical protein
VKLPSPLLRSQLVAGAHASDSRTSFSTIGHARFGSRIGAHRQKGIAAFTLLEILVSVALLSMIVLGLFAMFNQTQRAFRLSMTQSDILEAGRAVTEMIPRELEQTVASDRNAVNFSAVFNPNLATLRQSLPGTTFERTNLLQDCFMLLRQNQTWVGIGYCVRSADTNGILWLPETAYNSRQLGVGSLYRFTATMPMLISNPGRENNGLPQDPYLLYVAFTNTCVPGSFATTNLSLVCEGVTHFRLRAFATNGFPLFSDAIHANACFRTNSLTTGYSLVRQTQVAPSVVYPDNWSGLYFASNAIPAAVELELGLLEQRAWERYNSIGGAPARLAYLKREETSSRVHLFRQRIPLRNVNPLPYQ